MRFLGRSPPDESEVTFRPPQRSEVTGQVIPVSEASVLSVVIVFPAGSDGASSVGFDVSSVGSEVVLLAESKVESFRGSEVVSAVERGSLDTSEASFLRQEA